MDTDLKEPDQEKLMHLMREFFAQLATGLIEVYNEFSLHHELGIYLRAKLHGCKVQFERNVFDLFGSSDGFTKREIDICVFQGDTKLLAIELKYPRNGQHPETIFSFCKDVSFVEQLKARGFKLTAAVFLTDDQNFYRQAPPNGLIYDLFRAGKPIAGQIQKPTGKKDEWVSVVGTHVVNWNAMSGAFRYGWVFV